MDKLTAEEKKLRRKKIDNILTVVYLFVRFFFFEHFMIPSSSMTPTLQTGDVVFIKKYSYSWSRNSISLIGGYLPFAKEGVKFNSPKRGQLVVFYLKRDPKTYYVKRAIAVAGDKVQMKNGLLHINGKACEMEFIEDTTFLNDSGKNEEIKKYKLTLPFAPFHSYTVIRNKEFGQASLDNTPEYKVPAKHVWCQGDFNTGSADSFSDYMKGAVHENQLLGEPFFVLYNTKSRLPMEASWIAWGVQLPLRVLHALKETNLKRWIVFVK